MQPLKMVKDVRKENPGSCISNEFLCPVDFFNLCFLVSSLYFSTLAFLKSTGQLFCRMPLYVGMSDVST